MTKLNILVTGTSRGIGQSIVSALGAHNVVGHSTRDGDERRIGADLSQAGAATGFAWLFVVFATTHFLLDAATLDQLPKTANGLLDRLTIPNIQLNHRSPFEPDMTTPWQFLPSGTRNTWKPHNLTSS